MKKLIAKLALIPTIITTLSCDSDRIVQRPPEIVNVGERKEVYNRIMTEFPEHQNIKQNQSSLFEANATKHILLTQESEVFITYIAEGAGYDNTFGWYAYDSNNPPASRLDIKLNVLFPNVSGQVLKQGDRLKLSDKKFPAGTVIGFFLIIKGWSGGSIDYDKETFYSNIELNTDGQQQHVLFKQKEFGDVVLAFEDQLTSHVSDQDFNDIIFTVTDNTDNKVVTKFDVTNVVEL